MPRISPVGDVWAGIGDNVVSVNREQIALGGQACALDLRHGIFQVGASLYTHDVATKTTTFLDPDGANELRAGGGVYEATFRNILRISDRTVTFPGYNVGDVGFDGTCLVVLPDGTFRGQVLRSLQSLGDTGWIGTDERYRPVGTEPLDVPSGPIYGLRMSGSFICYQNAGRFIVSTARGRKGIVFEDVPKAFRPDLVQLPSGLLTFAYATGPAELPHEIVIYRDYDPAWLTEDIPDAVSVPPIGRAMWDIWFEHAAPSQPPPGHGILPFYGSNQGIAVANGAEIFVYASAEEEGTLEALNRAVAAAKARRPHLPVVPYWTRFDWPELPNGDWIGVQTYCPAFWTPDRFYSEMTPVYQRLRRERRKAAQIAQCYTSNTAYTSDLAALVPVFAQLAIDFPDVIIATVPFNDAGRANTGLAGHPEARQAWTDFFTSITGTPQWEDEMKAPKVQIKDPIPTVTETGFRLEVADPTNDQTVIVTTAAHPSNGKPSWFIEWKVKGSGSDKSGSYRPVTLDCPDPPPPPPPAEKTFRLKRQDTGAYVAVGADGYLTQSPHGDAFSADAGGIKVRGKFVAAEPPDGRCAANRDTVGEWEHWTIEKRGETTVALKSWQGRYLSVTDDGRVLANQKAIGGWETLVYEEGPATNPFPGLRVDGKFFSTVTGEPWHAIEATDFALCKKLCDGVDVRPILVQRAEIGFTLLRVWMLNASVMPEFSPRLYPQMYDRLAELADLAGNYGLALEVTAFSMVTGSTGLMNDPGEQQQHWDRICAAVRGKGNVLLEVYNEGDQYGGANRPTIAISKPDGVISSRGSNGSDSDPPDHGNPWDYEIYHIIGSAWQRKTGHNAMEWSDQSGRPCITNEAQRFIDNDSSLEHAEDSAAGGALLCAGTCFHSQEGKSSDLFTGRTLECAQAFVTGARSVPLEYRTGAYSHVTSEEGPQPDGSFVIRAYRRTLGDGRSWLVKIRGAAGEQ